MKQSLILLALVTGLLTGGVLLAADEATTSQPVQSINSDPKDLADDICWVAPEWRDD